MKNEQEIYNNLLIQYEKLNDIEKNAILVYKSKLFTIINSITKIPNYQELTSQEIVENLSNKNECINIFNSFSKILSNLRNIFIKNTVFNNIGFDDFYNFIEDLKNIINILNGINSKISLDEDIVVYRSILVEKDKQFDFITDSPAFISTSIKIEDAEKFLDGDKTKEKHFYKIQLSKDIPIIISPFSIVRKYESVVDSLSSNGDYTLMVSNRGINNQQEITLFRDYIEYEEINSKVIHDEIGDIYIHYVNVYSNKYIDDVRKK